MNHTLEERIRERAYEIWNTSGREHGRAHEHWLSAEREVLASVTMQVPRKRVRDAKSPKTPRRSVS